MRAYQLDQFGLDNLKLIETQRPEPGPDEILVDVKELSLNYRDLLVITGKYNPKLPLPAIPVSDGAGIVSAVGSEVTRVAVGDRVMSHFISAWLEGPFRQEYAGTTLGLPGPGLAADQVILSADAVVKVPDGIELSAAATLPIAALTAWSVLRTVTHVKTGQTVLTLGTGGVSIFAVQLARAMGADVIITSSSDEKLERARSLGATHTINYATQPKWEKQVLELTGGSGADVTVETVGAATLNQSLMATRAGGTIGLLGALKGLTGEVNTGLILMKRLHIAGVMVDSRAAFEDMTRFILKHDIQPVIDQNFAFQDLPAALRCMEAGRHFGKIVVSIE